MAKGEMLKVLELRGQVIEYPHPYFYYIYMLS